METNRGRTLRVGGIDLLKFLLCICIVGRHAQQTFGNGTSPFCQGNVAVDAFFIISGCLLCCSAERVGRMVGAADGPERGELGSETARFIGRKIKAVLVPYVVCAVIYIVSWSATKAAELRASEGAIAVVLKLVTWIPNLALLSAAGIVQTDTLLGATWYVSAMLIVMLAVYPLVRRLGRTYTLIVAPLVALALMGFVFNSGDGVYMHIDEWLVFLTYGMARGIIGINLGCAAYELARKLASLDLTFLARTLLTAAVILIGGIAWLVMNSEATKPVYAVVLLFVPLVGVLMSRQMAGSSLLDNPVCAYLGRGSMYVYFYHIAIRTALNATELSLSFGEGFAIMFGGAFAMYVVTDLLERVVRQLVRQFGIRPTRLFVRGV